MKKLRKIGNRIIADFRSCGWAIGAFFVLYLAAHFLIGAFCPLLVATGIPCAGCGLTRAVVFLIQGQTSRAADINPSLFPLLAFLLYCMYFRYIRGEKIRGFSLLLGLAAVCMLAIYLWRMLLYFPDRAPYVYREDNLAARWIPGYPSLVHRMAAFLRKWRAGQ